MRIGLTGAGSTVANVIRQAERAEADGFSGLWYPSAVAGDPLVAIALAGRATSTIELGTSVLQTYACHPVLQADRAAAVAGAIGSPGRSRSASARRTSRSSRACYGLSYDHPGRHTDEYVQVLTALLRGEPCDFDGEEFRVHATPPALVDGPRCRCW